MITSCYSNYPIAKRPSTQQGKRSPLPPLTFSVDTNYDGNYEPFEIGKENRPEPLQGKDQWARDFYSSIKYPAKAREIGIGGIVVLAITVNQNGKVENVDIKKGILQECDNEAKRAFLNSTLEGFFPLIIDNIHVKFKMELPVGFWLK